MQDLVARKQEEGLKNQLEELQGPWQAPPPSVRAPTGLPRMPAAAACAHQSVRFGPNTGAGVGEHTHKDRGRHAATADDAVSQLFMKQQQHRVISMQQIGGYGPGKQ